MRSIRIRYERCRKQALPTIVIRSLAPATRASRYPRETSDCRRRRRVRVSGFSVRDVRSSATPSRSGVRFCGLCCTRWTEDVLAAHVSTFCFSNWGGFFAAKIMRAASGAGNFKVARLADYRTLIIKWAIFGQNHFFGVLYEILS